MTAPLTPLSPSYFFLPPVRGEVKVRKKTEMLAQHLLQVMLPPRLLQKDDVLALSQRYQFTSQQRMMYDKTEDVNVTCNLLYSFKAAAQQRAVIALNDKDALLPLKSKVVEVIESLLSSEDKTLIFKLLLVHKEIAALEEAESAADLLHYSGASPYLIEGAKREKEEKCQIVNQKIIDLLVAILQSVDPQVVQTFAEAKKLCYLYLRSIFGPAGQGIFSFRGDALHQEICPVTAAICAAAVGEYTNSLSEDSSIERLFSILFQGHTIFVGYSLNS